MPDYEKQWLDYKRRRNLGLFLLIGYLPITFAFGIITVRLFHTEIPMIVFAISWMLLSGYVGTHNVVRCKRKVGSGMYGSILGGIRNLKKFALKNTTGMKANNMTRTRLEPRKPSEASATVASIRLASNVRSG